MVSNANLLFQAHLIRCREMIRLSGDGEIRTLDPLLARQVLSQLSYAPASHLAVPSLALTRPGLPCASAF